MCQVFNLYRAFFLLIAAPDFSGAVYQQKVVVCCCHCLFRPVLSFYAYSTEYGSNRWISNVTTFRLHWANCSIVKLHSQALKRSDHFNTDHLRLLIGSPFVVTRDARFSAVPFFLYFLRDPHWLRLLFPFLWYHSITLCSYCQVLFITFRNYFFTVGGLSVSVEIWTISGSLSSLRHPYDTKSHAADQHISFSNISL